MVIPMMPWLVGSAGTEVGRLTAFTTRNCSLQVEDPIIQRTVTQETSEKKKKKRNIGAMNILAAKSGNMSHLALSRASVYWREAG